MRKRKLGTTDTMVSPICLGCMGFGEPEHGQHQWTLDYEQTYPILKKAWEAGINFFDTAPAYSNGDSETFIGRFIKEEKIDRKKIVIATKFFPRTIEEIEQGVSMAEHIEKNLNASLQRLDTDYIDLYILHMWDYNTPIEQTLEALHDLVKKGRIHHIGISNSYAWQVAMANTIAAVMSGCFSFFITERAERSRAAIVCRACSCICRAFRIAFRSAILRSISFICSCTT